MLALPLLAPPHCDQDTPEDSVSLLDVTLDPGLSKKCGDVIVQVRTNQTMALVCPFVSARLLWLLLLLLFQSASQSNIDEVIESVVRDSLDSMSSEVKRNIFFANPAPLPAPFSTT